MGRIISLSDTLALLIYFSIKQVLNAIRNFLVF